MQSCRSHQELSNNYLTFSHVLPCYCHLLSFPLPNAERSFIPTIICLQKSASIQQRTSLSKFPASVRVLHVRTTHWHVIGTLRAGRKSASSRTSARLVAATTITFLSTARGLMLNMVSSLFSLSGPSLHNNPTNKCLYIIPYAATISVLFRFAWQL